MTLTVSSGCGTIAGNATVLVTASGVVNPTAISSNDVVTVSTSSDTTPAHSNTYAITPGQSVLSPTVSLSSTAASATNVTYTTSFTTSSTGALASDYSTITLAASAGTVFSSNSTYSIEDVTTSTQCGLNNWVPSNGGATVTLTIAGGCTVSGGDSVRVIAYGVSNPTTTSTGNTLSVSTSSDGLPAQTNTYAITTPKAVSSPTVALSTTAASATNVTYTAFFTTSSTGALAADYSTIVLAAPAGTVFSSTSTYSIEDVTTSTQCGLNNWVPSNGGATVTLTIAGSCTVAAGDAMQVIAYGVSNPTTTSTGNTLSISTSSDTVQAQTNTYAITTPKAVTSASVVLSTASPGATNVTYTTSFTTSSTGALASDYSTVTLAAAAGTVFSSSGNYTIEDVTTGTQCGLNNWVPSNGGATVTLTIAGGCTVAAGDSVQVVATEVTNPTTGASNDVETVSTSSDTVPAQTNTYAIGGSVATTTSLNGVTSPVTFGAETSEVFTGTVTGQSGDGNPQGTVTLYEGSPATQLCQSTLTASGANAATFSCALSASQLAAGSYNGVDAVYAPGSPSSSNTSFAYTTSTSSPTQSFTVSPVSVGTTTSLNSVTSPVTFGSETSEVFTGTVTGQSGDGNPQGTVTLYEGSPATQLCQSTLTASGANAATFSCALSATQLSLGTYNGVDAVYAPANPSSSNTNVSYTTSTSTPAQSFTVNGATASTTTSLNSVTSPVTFGSETSEVFTGTVTGQSGDGNPQGTVTLYEGSPATQLCQSTLTASGANAATFSCALSASQLAAGTFGSVDAVYTPANPSSSNLDFTYTTSTSTPAQSFTVSPASVATTTSLNGITSPVTFGAETSEIFSGTVTGQSGDGYPQGTVSVQSGATVLCSETLPAGSTDVASFSCSPTSGTVLAASSTPYSVTVTFTPVAPSSSNTNVTYTGSTSSPGQNLTVNGAPESTTTSLNTVTSPISLGAETSEVFTGTVTGQSGDGNPQGTVTLYEGSPATQLCQSTLTASGANAATFSCALSASQLAAATYNGVDAVYAPGSPSSSNTDFTYSTSTSTPTQSFTVSTSVSTEPTTTSLNGVTSPVTFGAETSEVFTGTVTGQSGDGNPQGTVTLYEGSPATQLCQSTLTASGANAATFSCALSASQLAAGSYNGVDAVYAPGSPSSSNTSFAYTTSTSSPTQSFTVSPVSVGTTTSLNSVTSPVTFGSETSEVFTGTVTGQSGDGNPQGTVTLYEGSPATQLCQSTLTASGANAATFSCALSATQLSLGTYNGVDAVYTPANPSSSNTNVSYTTSTSTPAQSFTVNGATASTTTSLNSVTSPVTFGSETSEVFTGTVTGQSGDGNPQGTVTLYEGSPATQLCQSTLTASGANAATFSCALSASQLAAGTFGSVDAVYTPANPSSSNLDFTYTTSTSTPAQSFTVSPAASTPQPTSLATSLSGGGQSGASISVTTNTAVTDSAALSGTKASTATGTVTYHVYSDAACTTAVSSGTAETITTPGTLPTSGAVTLAAAGLYYWQASYSGDANNSPSVSACGAELETVSSPGTVATTTICQTGQTCSGTVSVAGSMAVSITGVSSTTGSITVSVGSSTVSCGDPFRHAPSMTTVTAQGLTINGNKIATITINKNIVFAKGAPWWIPYAVCYSSLTAFRSITGKMVTTGLLPACKIPFVKPSLEGPPCVVSILPDRAGDVIETLELPGADPRFH